MLWSPKYSFLQVFCVMFCMHFVSLHVLPMSHPYHHAWLKLLADIGVKFQAVVRLLCWAAITDKMGLFCVEFFWSNYIGKILKSTFSCGDTKKEIASQWISHPNYIRVKMLNLFIIQFSVTCHFLSLLGPDILLIPYSLNTVNLSSFFRLQDQVSQPYDRKPSFVVIFQF
jgi:hypothetical protein